MKHVAAVAFALFAVIAVSSPARAGDPAKQENKKAPPAETAKKSPGTAIFVPATDIKWTDVPGLAGVQIAGVQGDPNKGASHFMLKYPAGFVSPAHHHTADHYVTVVSGKLNMVVDGADNMAGPGSFFAFTKKKVHIAKCEAGADCIMSIDARGKWDAVLPKEKKTAAKSE